MGWGGVCNVVFYGALISLFFLLPFFKKKKKKKRGVWMIALGGE
jgi:hypothetical protein